MEKLAALQESSLDLDGAAASWDTLAARFPRDPSVLSRAAEYFRNWGDPEKSRILLRKTVALDPADLQSALTLGELASAAGDAKEALACFEKILRESPAREDPGTIHFPGVEGADIDKLQESYFAVLRLRNGQPNADTMRALRAFWGPEGEKSSGEAALRLRAIRSASSILAVSGGKPALEALACPVASAFCVNQRGTLGFLLFRRA